MKATKHPRRSVTVHHCDITDRLLEVAEKLSLSPTEVLRTCGQASLPADPGWTPAARREWEESAEIAKRKLAVVK